MKYEAVFGNQELFDGAGTFTGLDVVVHSIASGIKSYARLSDLTPESLRNHPVCAMRRIIKTPTWSRADQEAGLLPPVGAKYLAGSDNRELECLYNDATGNVWGFDSRGAVFGYPLGYCRPIETPEEKAARLKSEWCAKAAKQLKNLEYTSTLTSIYDALLSGELKAPEVE